MTCSSAIKTSYDAASRLDDSEFNDLAKFSGVALLDAFVYGEFDVMDMPLDVRLGRWFPGGKVPLFLVVSMRSIQLMVMRSVAQVLKLKRACYRLIWLMPT